MMNPSFIVGVIIFIGTITTKQNKTISDIAVQTNNTEISQVDNIKFSGLIVNKTATKLGINTLVIFSTKKTLV